MAPPTPRTPSQKRWSGRRFWTPPHLEADAFKGELKALGEFPNLTGMEVRNDVVVVHVVEVVFESVLANLKHKALVTRAKEHPQGNLKPNMLQACYPSVGESMIIDGVLVRQNMHLRATQTQNPSSPGVCRQGLGASFRGFPALVVWVGRSTETHWKTYKRAWIMHVHPPNKALSLGFRHLYVAPRHSF